MKKKIAFISVHASPLAILGGVDSGGQNVYVAELAKELASKGFEIDIFTRRDRRGLSEIIYWMPGIRVIHIAAGTEAMIAKEELLSFMMDFQRNMLNFIRRRNLDYTLIHANFFLSAKVADFLKSILGIPYVVTFHALGRIRKKYQGDKDKFPSERMTIEKRAVKNADCIIAECPQDKTDLLNYYDASVDNIEIIPCGFNPSEFYPVERSYARRLLNISQEDNVVLQLGRMVPRKGVDNVICGMGYLKKRIDKMKLIIVGGPSGDEDFSKNPEMGRLKQIAAEEGIEDLVLFKGRKNREQLKYYYSAADVFITTPWYEPFGITPLEAMACGTPVIGSAVGGLKYSILDKKTGFLVPPDFPEILSDKMHRILTDHHLRKHYSEEALKRVNSLFTWSKVAEQISRLYYDVIYRVMVHNPTS